MIRILLWVYKQLNSKLLTTCVLSFFVVSATSTLAEYQPPLNPSSPSEPTTTTGRRGGCVENTEAALTTLAPQSYVGQTASTHPTFAWFVPDSKHFAVEFRLYQYGSNGNRQLTQTINLQSSPGIMNVSLPKDQPGLSVGQRYRWQVVILCNPNHPSSALVAESEIEVVEMPPALKAELSASSDRLERAKQYAKAGLWYDAFGEAIDAKDDSTMREFELTLLQDLVRLEDSGSPGKESEHTSQLRQIVKLVGR